MIYGYFELLPPEPGKDGSKGSLRITARVLDVKHSRQGTAFSEVGALEDLATLEAHLGWQTLQSLHPKTAPPEREFMTARPSVRLDAVENYVRGLLATSAEQRHHYFTQAARLDEHYSQPCFQLGKTYWEKKDYKVAAGWLERVARTDPHYLESLFFLGLCRYLSGDFKGAEECLQLVVAALPLNEVYNDLGVAQAQRQDYAAAAASFSKAIEGDDTDPDFHFNMGVALWRSAKYPEAADSFRATLDRNAEDNEATSMLGRCLKREAPRPGDTRTEGKPRLKTNYEENAFRQLQAELKK
jgi:tetratricopeptide (TPR) repeat protein